MKNTIQTMMIKKAVFSCVLVMGICASPAALSADDAPTAVGDSTRAWVELQKSNRAASAEAYEMPGDVADKVYQRYVNSFSYPIPEQFEREAILGNN